MSNNTQAQVEKSYFNFDDNKLYYEIHGNGIPIIFIHGYILDCRIWDPQMEFATKGYQVIRYDVRGFGKSSLVEATHYPAEDLKKLIDFLKIDQAIIVGLSMGGNIALRFAIDYPENVKKLVLVDADVSGFKNYSESFRSSFGELYNTAAQKGVEAAKKIWQESTLLTLHNNSIEKSDLLQQIMNDYNGRHMMNPALRPSYPQPYSITQLSKIQIPVLVLVGQYDIIDFHDMAKILSTEIPGAAFSEIPNANHISNLDNPEDFNAILLNFLAN